MGTVLKGGSAGEAENRCSRCYLKLYSWRKDHYADRRGKMETRGVLAPSIITWSKIRGRTRGKDDEPARCKETVERVVP